MIFKDFNKEIYNNNKKQENDSRLKELVYLLRGMYEATGEPCIKFKLECIELNETLDSLALHLDTLSHNQYYELTNVVNQFKEVIENYIKENNITIEE